MWTRRTFPVLLAAVVALPLLGQDTFQNVPRIVAVGDVHGDYEQFVSILRAAETIDQSMHWSGGKTHLVQVGDIPDRGPDTRKVMDLLMELEPQAKKAGGRIHALLGNHETMNMYGDLRYTTDAEFASYRKPNSKDMPGHPVGWRDQRQAFEPEGRYGKWLRQHNAIIRINDLIFLHGGISPKYAQSSLKDINNEVHDELLDFSKLDNGMIVDPDGPLWYRGLADLPESPALEEQVNQVLKSFGVRHIVIGHTIQPAVIPRLGGKVIAIDVGMSKAIGGPAAALIVEGTKYYAIHRGKRLELPMEGGDVVAYLKACAALDPQPSPIDRLIQTQSPGGKQ